MDKKYLISPPLPLKTPKSHFNRHIFLFGKKIKEEQNRKIKTEKKDSLIKFKFGKNLAGITSIKKRKYSSSFIGLCCSANLK